MQSFTSATIAAAYRLVKEAEILFRPLEITVAQFDALELLANAPEGLRPSQLAEALIVDPSSTTYLMDQLAKRKWITRKKDPLDRRAYRVFLAPAGGEIHARAGQLYQLALCELGKLLDPIGCQAATKLLLSLPAHAEAAAKSVASQATA